MTHRIDLTETHAELLIEVQGLIDAAALDGLRRALAHAGSRAIRVVLRAGTEVDAAAIDALRRLGPARVVAESPFLSRWLAEGGHD